MNSDDFYTVRGYEILEKENKPLTHSMEDYLEMIYRKSLEGGYTRINILAESLNVQPPSATKMVQKLTKLGFIKYKKYGIIQLTEKGENMGAFLLNRHRIIESFFKIIGVEEDLLVNIELMEHNITKDALDKIQRLNNFFKDNADIKESFSKYMKNK
ncbi:Transcriptional regulator MntR [Clostridium liquoris]|uniref:Manganese transport regulator n=1 Tax=Clostridium liquoris TaxID=1289519 RepID=A0A2T0B3N2_9CLOT|nr:iron dependent repressor, metal binding and dimerization domain protein [Clostridium liquoris]PRR78510.1 Transcriptional regulator MntR [Clostridium liquoris]